MGDMVLFNGRIFTAEAARPWAQAVAIRDGRFVAVGRDEEVKKLIGKDINGLVTSVLQTPAGRMIFVRPKK